MPADATEVLESTLPHTTLNPKGNGPVQFVLDYWRQGPDTQDCSLSISNFNMGESAPQKTKDWQDPWRTGECEHRKCGPGLFYVGQTTPGHICVPDDITCERAQQCGFPGTLLGDKKECCRGEAENGIYCPE
jgi:hypothetical protein